MKILKDQEFNELTELAKIAEALTELAKQVAPDMEEINAETIVNALTKEETESETTQELIKELETENKQLENAIEEQEKEVKQLQSTVTQLQQQIKDLSEFPAKGSVVRTPRVTDTEEMSAEEVNQFVLKNSTKDYTESLKKVRTLLLD